MATYKQKFSLDVRRYQSSKVLNKYPDKIPIICEKSHTNVDLPNLDRQKYLVPKTLTLGDLICVIKKKINLNYYDAIFLSINDKILPGYSIIGNIYDCEKDSDGMLYIQYNKENAFG